MRWVALSPAPIEKGGGGSAATPEPTEGEGLLFCHEEKEGASRPKGRMGCRFSPTKNWRHRLGEGMLDRHFVLTKGWRPGMTPCPEGVGM